VDRPGQPRAVTPSAEADILVPAMASVTVRQKRGESHGAADLTLRTSSVLALVRPLPMLGVASNDEACRTGHNIPSLVARLAPAELRRYEPEDALNRVGVVLSPTLARDGQEQRGGGLDRGVRGALVDRRA